MFTATCAINKNALLDSLHETEQKKVKEILTKLCIVVAHEQPSCLKKFIKNKQVTRHKSVHYLISVCKLDKNRA